jgi:hypothetical protein
MHILAWVGFDGFAAALLVKKRTALYSCAFVLTEFSESYEKGEEETGKTPQENRDG